MDLRDHFGSSRVFRDVDSIPAGTDFVEVIEHAVSRSRVVLALIGGGWLTAADAEGQRRLDNPDDFVRVELECAFERGIVVIPVLVEQAQMPVSTMLPPTLVKLSRMQGIELSDERWQYDVGRLITRLEEIVGAGNRLPTTPAIPEETGFSPIEPAEVAADAAAAEPPTVPTPPTPITGDDDDVAPKPTRRRRRRVVLAAIGALVTLLVAGVSTGAIGSGPPGQRVVPLVVGQESGAATAALHAADFTVVIKDVADDDKPVGAVVIQDPPGGGSAEKGAAVTISIARSSGKVAVPPIVALKRSEAEAALQSAGLVARWAEATSETVAADQVISQSPVSPVRVDKGSAVDVVVSTGTPQPTQSPRRTYGTSKPTTPHPTTTRPSPPTTRADTTVPPSTETTVTTPPPTFP